MEIKNHKITMRQLQALIIMDTFGVLAVCLPQSMARLSGQNSWIWITAAGIIVSLIAAMAVSMDGSSLYKSCAGRTICILLCGKIILCTGVVLKIFASTVTSLLLDKTPVWIISGIMTLLCLHAALQGIKTRARAAEILFFVVALILIFVYMLTAYNMEIENLMPLSLSGGFKSTWQAVFSVFGVEYLLFIRPYLNGNRPAAKRALSAGILCSVLLGLTVLLTTAVFGAANMQVKNWAVLQVVNTIDFPIMLVERQDIIITAFWIGSAFAFLNAGVYYTGLLLSQAGVRKERDVFLFWASGLLIWAVSLYPSSIDMCMELLWKLRILNFIVYAAIIAAFVFKKGVAVNEK